MKKILSLICVVAVVCVLAAGCTMESSARAAESPSLEPRGDVQLIERMETSDGGNGAVPENGTRVQREFRSADLPMHVTMDAPVEVPDVSTFSAYKALPHTFTSQERERIVSVLAQGARVANIRDADALEVLQADIEEEKDLLHYLQEVQKRDDDSVDTAKACIEELEERAQKGTPLAQLPELQADAGGEFIKGAFVRDGHVYVLTFMTDSALPLSHFVLRRMAAEEWNGSDPGPEQMDLEGMTYAQAVDLAQETARNIGADAYGMELSRVEPAVPADEPHKAHIDFTFTKMIDGVPVGLDQTWIQSRPFEESADVEQVGVETLDAWQNESLTMTVDKDGLRSLEWIAPTEVGEVVNAELPLVDFEDVLACFDQAYFIDNEDALSLGTNYDGVHWDWSFDPGEVQSVEVLVQEIRLSLGRVQAGSEYLFVPVWDFYGVKRYLNGEGVDANVAAGVLTQEELDKSLSRPDTCALFTVNAADGSVIDRSRGY